MNSQLILEPVPSQLRDKVRWRKPTLIVLLLVAVLLVFCGGRLLLAGISAWQAERFLLDWNTRGEVPSEPAWQVAHDAAQRAVTLYPGANGEYYDRLGRILESRHATLPFGSSEADGSRRAALDAYRQAIEARPLWPFTWSQLAYVKLRLLEFDEEFDQAFARGFELGPWRLGSNALLAEVALLAWPSLDEVQRAQARESMRRTVDWSQGEARRLAALAARVGMQPIFCGALDDARRIKRKIC